MKLNLEKKTIINICLIVLLIACLYCLFVSFTNCNDKSQQVSKAEASAPPITGYNEYSLCNTLQDDNGVYINLQISTPINPKNVQMIYDVSYLKDCSLVFDSGNMIHPYEFVEMTPNVFRFTFETSDLRKLSKNFQSGNNVGDSDLYRYPDQYLLKSPIYVDLNKNMVYDGHFKSDGTPKDDSNKFVDNFKKSLVNPNDTYLC